MLSSLKPGNGKFVLGPPVDTDAPVVVFTGPADHPDAISQTASAAPKKKKRVAAKTTDKPDKTEEAGGTDKAADKPANPAKGAKKTAKPAGAKAAKPKVSSANQ
jgi:hypothetical protein